MSALLEHPEIARLVEGLEAVLIDSSWPERRKGIARSAIRGLAVRAGQIASDGARPHDVRAAVQDTLDMALALAGMADPELAAAVSEEPLEAAGRMQALIVGMIEAVRKSAGRAET